MALGRNINSTAIKFLLQQSHKMRKETSEKQKQNINHCLTKTPLQLCLCLCWFCTKIQAVQLYSSCVSTLVCCLYVTGNHIQNNVHRFQFLFKINKISKEKNTTNIVCFFKQILLTLQGLYTSDFLHVTSLCLQCECFPHVLSLEPPLLPGV